MRVAVLVDGSFFVHQHRHLKGSVPPDVLAESLMAMCYGHLRDYGADGGRLLYYDAKPLGKKASHPVTNETIDFAHSPSARYRMAFFKHLELHKELEVRFGYLNQDTARWRVTEAFVDQVQRGHRTLESLKPADFRYDAHQKGVDVKIALDIAKLAYNKSVDRIVLVSGDSDFVSAIELAKAQGIAVTVDPMWRHIRVDMKNAADNIRSVFPRPNTDGQQAATGQATVTRLPTPRLRVMRP